MGSWTSVQIATLVVDGLTPVTVAGLGVVFARPVGASSRPSGPTRLWSPGGWTSSPSSPPVDQLWTDPVVAEEWRAAWHQGGTDLGAPDAARPASPLCDSVFDDYPGKSG
jgi:hypothetical protein